MSNVFITNLGKAISLLSRLINLGSGSTWPGHIALGLEKNYIQHILKDSPTQIILVVGTNGKTTTGRILTTIFQKNKKRVFQNSSGANLLNGIASSLLLNTNFLGKLTADYAIFEVDENNLPLVLKEITPKAIIALDLFRDQLDRYGELDSIAKKWEEAFRTLPSTTHLILNADDPLIAYLGLSLSQNNNSISFFGLDPALGENKSLQHAADSLYCPRCNNKLIFKTVFYSHLGIWKCMHCKLERPLPNLAEMYYPLDGIYNKYNTLAASLTAITLGFSKDVIDQALHAVTPAFGRQEKIQIKDKTVQLFLAKNPTSFNEALRTIAENNNHKFNIMYVLNDRIPDGRDISWIWDIDIEQYIDMFGKIFVSGDRVFDMALRVRYAQKYEIRMSKSETNANPKIPTTNYCVEPNLKLALQKALENTPMSETLYILPTYSAMLEVRKILTGKSIL